jgi:predicted DNA-binding transcriptional regulator AlpA
MQTITERRINRLARRKQAAAYVGESSTTFWRHVKAGIWPAAISIGGVPMYDLNAFDARIEELKAAQKGEAA